MKKLIAGLFSLSICITTYASKPIIIGLDADMTAVAKEGGIAIQRGVEIAIAEINEQGGVLNRELKLVTKNHRGNPARGISNLQKLSKLEDLVAVVGGVHTPVALKELPIIHENKLIYLDPWAAGTPIVDNGFQPNYVFRVSVRDAEAAKVLIPYAKSRGVTKVALLLERTGWGRSNEKSLTVAANLHGVEISDIVWFNWGQKSFNEELTSLQASGSQAIILVANAPEGAEIAKAMLTQKSKMPIFSHWGIAGGNFVDRVGTSQLQQLDISVLQTYSFLTPHNSDLNTAVLRRYQSLFGNSYAAKNIPGAVGTAHAYDLVHLLAKAINKAGNTHRPDIRNALESISQHSGLVKNYQPPFSPKQHDALLSKDYIMTSFDTNGHLVPILE
mgnify:CR=1 FL=1